MQYINGTLLNGGGLFHNNYSRVGLIQGGRGWGLIQGGGGLFKWVGAYSRGWGLIQGVGAYSRGGGFDDLQLRNHDMKKL